MKYWRYENLEIQKFVRAMTMQQMTNDLCDFFSCKFCSYFGWNRKLFTTTVSRESLFYYTKDVIV